MIKRILIYIGVFLLTLYCFFIYEDDILETIMVVEVIYFIASLIRILLLYGKLQANIIELLPIAEKNQEIPITILVRNNLNTIVPVHFDILIQVENTFTGEKIKHMISGKVKRGEPEKVSCKFKVKDCGNIKISVKRLYFYDWLFILKNSVRVREVSWIGVLPECHLLPIEVTRGTREFIADADEYSAHESGDDLSETYQIREYRKGDSIHDIHWKLSAKSEELLVVEHGKPLGCAALIWLNLCSSKKNHNGNNKGKLGFKPRKKVVSKTDVPINVLEMAASLSISLLEEKCVHMVAWYEPDNHSVKKKRISKEKHIYELLHRLMYVKTYSDEREAQVQYEEAFRGESFSTIVELLADGDVIVNKEKMEIPTVSGQVKWEDIYFTV